MHSLTDRCIDCHAVEYSCGKLTGGRCKACATARLIELLPDLERLVVDRKADAEAWQSAYPQWQPGQHEQTR